MKSILVISFLVIFCLVGCDVWKILPLQINNSATFVAQKDSCGIILSVEKLQGPSTSFNIMVDCTAGVTLDFDSLRIIGGKPNGLTVNGLHVGDSKHIRIKERKLFVSERRKLKIGLHVISDTANKEMLILPTSFAKCGNRVLIEDTLKVRL